MNMSVGEFIPCAGQRNDLLDRMRRRLDVYRQRHVEMEIHFDGRRGEISERLRQETAVYHKKWMDSKAKRTTSKSKASQRGDGSLLNSNGLSSNSKLKRKSHGDEQLPDPKAARNDDAVTGLGRNFDEPPSSTTSDNHLQRNMLCVAGKYGDPQFHVSVSAGHNTVFNPVGSDSKLKFESSLNEVVSGVSNSDVAFDGTAFCKLEPKDDSDSQNAIDVTSDVLNFDDLFEFLDGIGRDGDLPADILQVLNQGELDNVGCHDASVNTKDGSFSDAANHDNVIGTSSLMNHDNTARASSMSGVREISSSMQQCLNSAEGSDFKRASPNGLSALNKFSTPDGTQMSLSVDIEHGLVNDSGPAAETLKQMAARRSQESVNLGYGSPQNRQRTASRSSVPDLVGELRSSAGVISAPGTLQYCVSMAPNSTTPQPAALQLRLPDKTEQQVDFPPMNSSAQYGLEQQGANSHVRSHGQAYYHAVGDFAGFTIRNAPGENRVNLSAGENQQRLALATVTSHFGPRMSSIAMQQYFNRLTPNCAAANSSQSQTTVRSTAVNPVYHRQALVPSSSYLPVVSGMQVTEEMMKKSYLPPCNIKMEADTTAWNSERTAVDINAGGAGFVKQYRNNPQLSDYLSLGVAQITQSPFSRSNVSPYLKESQVRVADSGNQMKGWAVTETLRSAYESRGAPNRATAPGVVLGYRMMRQQQNLSSSHPTQQQQQQQHPRHSLGGWTRSFLPSTSIGHLHSSSMQTPNALLRQNSGFGGSNALMIQPNQNAAQPGLFCTSGRMTSANNTPLVDPFLSCGDSSGRFASVARNQLEESVELSLIDDFINGK